MEINNNPFINRPIHKYGTVAFNDIKPEHYIPAINYAIKKAEDTIEIIKNSSDDPTFDNTVLPMETCTELLDSISTTYFNIMGAESDNSFKELAQEISPKLSGFTNKVLLDSTLFKRIKYLYDHMESQDLTMEQKRLISEKYKTFTLNGALLEDIDKKKVRKIDKELSSLSPKFSQNALNATNNYTYHTNDESILSGIPDMAKNLAAETAKKKGKKSGWMLTLQTPSLFPVLKYANNRELRKILFLESGKISFGGEFDNQDIIKKIVSLRFKKASLLGFKDHADYILQKRMAGDTKTVMKFIERLYDVYFDAAKKELKKIKELAREDGINEIQAWDLAYYTEKLKIKKFDINEEALRPYFSVENVIKGIFKVADLLYGLQFKEIFDVPVYHKDVRVFHVKEKNGNFLSLLYIDLHPRETKSGGAWMTSWRSQGLFEGKLERPLISIVANLTPPSNNIPALLTYDEVNTIFHEFGHALHGMLSNVTYRSLASPDVYWDFVELPSQIMENWLSEKETLRLFAKHYKTGETIPNKFINKIKKSQSFNAGIFGLRQISLGILDMSWHTDNPTEIENVGEFEDRVLEKTRLLPRLNNTNISCKLGHIFAGGYSAGYYSYKWAETLDADAFELFKQKGIFNKEIAESFRKNILEKGNSESPMDIYVKFRGKEPDPDALLRRDELIE